MTITKIEVWGGGRYDFALVAGNYRTETGLSGGKRDILPHLTSEVTIRRKLGESHEMDLVIRAASPFATSILLFDRIYVWYSDGRVEGYRVVDKRTDFSGASDAVFKARWMPDDLGRTVFQYVLAPTNHATFRLPLRGMTLTDALGVVFNTTYGITPAFHLGAVDSVFASAIVDLDANASTHLALLNALCAQAGCEWEPRFDAASHVWYIDIVREAGWTASERAAGAANPSRRRIESPDAGAGNRLDMQVSHSEDEYFTRIYPVSSDGDALAGIEGAVWTGTIETITAGAPYLYRLGLNGRAVPTSGALTGLYALVKNSIWGTRAPFRIAESIAPSAIVIESNGPQAWAVGAGLDLIIAQATGPIVPPDEYPPLAHVACLTDPIAETLHGRADTVREFSIPPYENIAAEYGVSADLGRWLSGMPVGYAIIGGATVERVTDPDYVRFGRAACKVTCPAIGDGIETIPLPLAPYERRTPYLSVLVSGRGQVGRARLSIYQPERAGNPAVRYPADTSTVQAEFAADETLAIAIEGETLPVKTDPTYPPDMMVQMIAQEPGTVFYFDALTVTQSAGAWDYAPRMGRRALWEAAADLMSRKGGVQPPALSARFYDLRTLTSRTVYDEVTCGSWVRVVETGIEGGDEDVPTGVAATAGDARATLVWTGSETGALTARVHELVERYDPALGSLVKEVSLERRPVDISDRLAPQSSVVTSDRAPETRTPVTGTGAGASVYFGQVTVVDLDGTGGSVRVVPTPALPMAIDPGAITVTPFAQSGLLGFGIRSVTATSFEIWADTLAGGTVDFNWTIAIGTRLSSGPGTQPPPPTNISAEPGDASVTLAWSYARPLPPPALSATPGDGRVTLNW